jgi:hypothetical protein
VLVRGASSLFFKRKGKYVMFFEFVTQRIDLALYVLSDKQVKLDFLDKVISHCKYQKESIKEENKLTSIKADEKILC